MPEVLDSYINLKISVNEKVTNEKAKQEILEVLDRNIQSTSHAVPEFETFAILILMVSITSIIIVSRKISFISINYN